MTGQTDGSQSAGETPLFDAARTGDVETLVALLDAHPDGLYAREEPYEWTLLHTAAQGGHLAVVDLLLSRGLDANTRERGDNSVAMHWAAAAGHLDVVRRLADAGGDVVGHGDDHELDVVGWASCWEGCDDVAHRAVVDFLVSRGARHHIFSAIAMNLGDELRQIVAADPASLNKRMSRNENNQTPLHFAVRMKRPEMIALLLHLGADPLAVDGFGQSVAAYATTGDIDRAVMQSIHAMTVAELSSARRGDRASRSSVMDIVASLVLEDWATAARVLGDNPELLESGGALHLMAKRGDVRAVTWLLDHGVGPNARWNLWGASVTALHMAAWSGNTEIARHLLAAGADPHIRDSKHDGDAVGWADHFERPEMRQIFEAHVAPSSSRKRRSTSGS